MMTAEVKVCRDIAESLQSWQLMLAGLMVLASASAVAVGQHKMKPIGRESAAIAAGSS
jgi:hypothetical protein